MPSSCYVNLRDLALLAEKLVEAYNRAFAGVLELGLPPEEEMSTFRDSLRSTERE